MSSVNQSLQTYDKASQEATTAQQKLATCVQDELQALCSNIADGNALQEQVTECRESKAVLHERLEATISELAKAQLETSQLREKRRDQREKILALEADVTKARANTMDNSAIMLRLHDLEVANKELENQMSVAGKESKGLKLEIEKKSEEAAYLNTRLSGVQLQLEESVAIQESLHNERAAVEQRASIQSAHDKKALSEASDNALARLQSELENDQQQLRHELEEARKEIENLSVKADHVFSKDCNDDEQLAIAKKELNKVICDWEREVILL